MKSWAASVERRLTGPVTADSLADRMAACGTATQYEQEPAFAPIAARCRREIVFDISELADDCGLRAYALALADRHAPRWPAAEAAASAKCQGHAGAWRRRP